MRRFKEHAFEAGGKGRTAAVVVDQHYINIANSVGNHRLHIVVAVAESV